MAVHGGAGGQQEATPIAWHAQYSEAALASLLTSAEGLSKSEAQLRLALYGYNRMPEGERRSALSRLLAQFNNVLIYVPLGAVAVAALLGHGADSAVILLVVIANGVIGFIQEGRAKHALESNRAVISAQASVMRG